MLRLQHQYELQVIFRTASNTVVFRQVGLTAHGLKSRLVFARALCWPQTQLPQAWIGCWTGLLNHARLVWRLARAPSLIWILLTMSLSLLNC